MRVLIGVRKKRRFVCVQNGALFVSNIELHVPCNQHPIRIQYASNEHEHEVDLIQKINKNLWHAWYTAASPRGKVRYNEVKSRLPYTECGEPNLESPGPADGK